MYSLTPKQREVFEIIAAYIGDHGGTAPSVREIMALAGIKSTARVVEVLDALEERGWIKRLPQRRRSITIIEPARAEKEGERVRT